jgi:hypothetical protein
VSGRANLDWQVRKEDAVQLNLVVNGRRLQAQGVDRPGWTLNLGWRHKVNDRISLTFTAQDVLATNGYSRRFDTPQLVERYDYRPVSRAVFLRLDYRFGGSGKAAREPGFEYETSGSAAPG